MSESAVKKRNVGLAARSVRSVGLNPQVPQPEAQSGEESIARRLGQRWADMDVRLRFTIIDSFLSFFIFTPLVLVYWYGVYGLLERLVAVLPIPEALGPWAMLGLGIYVESLVCFLQRDLHLKLTSGSPEDLSHYIGTRFFNLFFSVANIAHYRGIELLFQEHVNVNLRVAFQTAVTATALLWGMKCGRNIIGPPLCVEVDSEVTDVFQQSTRFKTSPEKSMGHLLDSIATISIVTTLVHTHWISITAVFDYVLYPNNVGMSIVASCVIGYSIVLFFVLFQGPARKISSGLEQRTGFVKVVFEDFFFLGANIGVILVWKGWGQFFDALGRSFPIYHSDVDVTWLYACVVPFLLLVLVHSSGTLVTKGCDVDGELQGGEGINFSLSYFAGFFAEEIEEQLRKQDAARARKPLQRKDVNLNYNSKKLQ